MGFSRIAIVSEVAATSALKTARVHEAPALASRRRGLRSAFYFSSLTSLHSGGGCLRRLAGAAWRSARGGLEGPDQKRDAPAILESGRLRPGLSS